MSITPSNRQLKSETNRKTLLKSALDLFDRYGYSQVTVDDIVKNVNMSKGSFYNLFRSKSDLIIYRSEVLGEDILKNYAKLSSEPGYRMKNAVDKIRDLIIITIDTSTSSSNVAFLSQMFISVMNDPPEDAMNFYEQHQTDLIVSAIILGGQQNGEIRDDMNCDEILRAIHVFNRSLLLEWCYKKGKYNIIERNKDTIEIFCKGISGDKK